MGQWRGDGERPVHAVRRTDMSILRIRLMVAGVGTRAVGLPTVVAGFVLSLQALSIPRETCMRGSLSQGAPAELWQALVREVRADMGAPLDEWRESYLVFVLLRYQRDPFLLARTQALAWLHALQQVGTARADALRDIGDHCLLIAGLFPGLAERRRVQVDYFIELGRGAYREVAVCGRSGTAGLFAQLAECYRELVRTLAGLRRLPHWQASEGGILLV